MSAYCVDVPNQVCRYYWFVYSEGFRKLHGNKMLAFCCPYHTIYLTKLLSATWINLFL